MTQKNGEKCIQDEQFYFRLTLNKSYYIYIRECKNKTTTKGIGDLPATSQNVVARVDSFGELMPSKNKICMLYQQRHQTSVV